MDARAISTVHEAINSAKVTNKPIARFDSDENKPYLEYPNVFRHLTVFILVSNSGSCGVDVFTITDDYGF